MAGPLDRSGALGADLAAAIRRGVETAVPLWPFYLVMYAVGALHLAEVHLLDPVATSWMRGVLGDSLALFAPVEAPVYEAIGALWRPGLVAGVSLVYLGGFVGLLWWTPPLVAATGDRERLTRVLLTYPIVYLLGLPGYLFATQLNPYVALGLADPFSPLGAGLEEAYYLFTTPNNTFPSLHVAYTAALTVHLARAWRGWASRLAGVHGGLLVASVVYLRVHWIGDVLGGLAVAGIALVLADRAARGRGILGGVVERLDRTGREGYRWLADQGRDA